MGGNASEKQSGNKWEFTCQHGATECYGNALDTCIQSHVKDNATSLQAVACIETIANVQGHSFETALTQCAEQYKFDASAVDTCAKGDEGNALQHQAALATPDDHQYVPWLVVDGKHPGTSDENDILDNVFSWACKHYNGSDKPFACSAPPARLLEKPNEVKSASVCLNTIQVFLIPEQIVAVDN